MQCVGLLVLEQLVNFERAENEVCVNVQFGDNRPSKGHEMREDKIESLGVREVLVKFGEWGG